MYGSGVVGALRKGSPFMSVGGEPSAIGLGLKPLTALPSIVEQVEGSKEGAAKFTKRLGMSSDKEGPILEELGQPGEASTGWKWQVESGEKGV